MCVCVIMGVVESVKSKEQIKQMFLFLVFLLKPLSLYVYVYIYISVTVINAIGDF